MAKRIGNLNAQITADGLQFRAELTKCEASAGRFADNSRKTSDSVIGSLEGMLKKGSLGKLADGFGRLTAAVGTAWAAFQAGQAIREEISEWLKTGAEQAAEFYDALNNSATQPATALKTVNAEIDRLQAMLAKKAEGSIWTIGLDTKQMEEKLAGLQKRAGALFRTVNAPKVAAEKKDERDRGAAQAAKDADEMARFQKDLQEAESRRVKDDFENFRVLQDHKRDLASQLAQDQIAFTREAAASATDDATRQILQRQAMEMESAQRIAELKRQLDSETDDEARRLIQDRIDLEKSRIGAGLEPKTPEASPLRNPTAFAAGTADEQRTRFLSQTLNQGRRAEDTGKRQTRLLEIVSKTLKNIESNTAGDIEIVGFLP